MMTFLLPDGTGATTPIYVGGNASIPKPCPDDPGHDWQTDMRKDPLPAAVEIGGVTFTHATLELCKKCNWVRSRLYRQGDEPGTAAGKSI